MRQSRFRDHELVRVLAGLGVAVAVGGCGEPARSSERPSGSASAPAAQAPASGAAAQPTATPTTTPVPGDVPEAPLDGNRPGQIAAINVAAMVEGCFAARPDYRLCTHPRSAGHLELPPIVDRDPEPGEARVIADSARSYTVIARDADGTAWTIQRGADGVTSRACRSASADGCDDPSWAAPAGG